MVDWSELDDEEVKLIHQIAKRGAEYAFAHGREDIGLMDLTMSTAAAHVTTGLDLERLLSADQENFVHDVFGINRYVDRETGELRDNFLPRFSAREEATA